MSAVILIFSVVSLIFAEERLALTGSDHAVTAHVGEEVILNCFVDSHILPDQVSWMKIDSDKSNILVLLFQNNETYPDSADPSYQGRTEFFNAEIPKGNFSLRLKDVRTEDKGVYMCEAHSGHLSANTTVTLQRLGLSSLHMLVLALCCSAIIVALVFSAVILSKGIKDVSQMALKMHYVLVFVPSIFMFSAFVLWGVIEGFLGEVVTCSTLNLTRFVLLFKTSVYKEKLPEMIKTIIEKAFIFEYFIVVSVLYFVIFFNVWNIEGESKAMTFMGIMYGSSLHMGIQAFFAEEDFYGIYRFFYLFSVSYSSRTFNDSAFSSMFVGVAIAILSGWIAEGIMMKRYPFMKVSYLFNLGYLAYILVRRLIMSTVVFYFFSKILANNDERAGLLCITALLHLLNLADYFAYKSTLSETPKMVLYLYGAIGAHVINGTTLTTELILKSRKGERTIADLRVVVLPFEYVFILGWIWAHAYAYWAEYKTRVNKELSICKLNGCRQWIKSLKENAKPEDGCEMAEITHQSSSTGLKKEQGSPQGSSLESPSNADINIHAPGDIPEETDVVLSESDEIIHEEYSPSTETVGESITPLHPDADMNGSTAKDISTSPILEDNDAVSKTLLSHGERELETNPEESKQDSVTEHMESSPLLQEEMGPTF